MSKPKKPLHKGHPAKAPKETIHRRKTVEKGSGGRVHDADLRNFLERDRLLVEAREVKK